jgi:uncharacterized membrane protein (TIGR02234 family)
MTRARAWFALALLADLLGATGVLISVGRGWQRVVVTRQAPLADAVVHLSGRYLSGATAALSFIALAGVVAIAATRGIGRRLVGVALLASGAAITWLAVTGLTAVSAARARASVPSGVGVDASSRTHVTVLPAWPTVTIVSGLLIALAGLCTILFAGSWSAMSNRYEAPTAAAKRELPTTDLALWSALDRGDDPTALTES